MNKLMIFALVPLIVLSLIPFIYAIDIDDSETYLIRDSIRDDIFISFMVEKHDNNNSVFNDGYFVINNYLMDAHESDISSFNDSEKTLSILGMTTTGEQFVIIFDKSTGLMTYEFWISGKQYRGQTETVIDIL